MNRRLSVLISDEEQIRMRNLIPWGMISRIMRLLLLQTLDLVEKHGVIVIGALASEKFTVLDLLREEVTSGSQRLEDKYIKP